ncbi:MAG: hypothetical protein KDA92_20970 [Planctomycetales bacterium]|nr:hypothetical protein [Planctomycetales bacterium]
MIAEYREQIEHEFDERLAVQQAQIEAMRAQLEQLSAQIESQVANRHELIEEQIAHELERAARKVPKLGPDKALFERIKEKQKHIAAEQRSVAQEAIRHMKELGRMDEAQRRAALEAAKAAAQAAVVEITDEDGIVEEEIDVNIAEEVDIDVDVEAVVELADELSELELKPLPKETLDAIAKIRKEHASGKKLAKKLVEDKRKTLEAERKRTEILLQRLLELEAKLREEQ